MTQECSNMPAAEKAFRKLLAIGLLLFAFQCGIFVVSCVDVGFHIRTGELVLEQRSIPSVNTFSFAQPDHPWYLHQWAPAVLYYLAYAFGGVRGLIVFKAAVGAAIFLVVWLSSNRETGRGSYWPFWAATAGLMLARARFFERPYMFSALLLAALFYLQRRYSGKWRWEWLGLPALMALWANTHAGVVDGFALLAAFCGADLIGWVWSCVGKKGRCSSSEVRGILRLPLGMVVSLAAAMASVRLINPNGIPVLLIPFDFLGEPFWRNLIVELQAPSGLGASLLYGYIVALALLQISVARRFDRRLFVASAVFGCLACRSQRYILPFVVVATPYLGALLESAIGESLSRARRIHWLTLPLAWALLFGFVVLPNKTIRYGTGLYGPYYPSGVYEFMRKNVPRQNLYNDMMYGGGILWFLYPEFRPFIDGRGEAYSLEFWRDICIPLSDGILPWEPVFREHGIHGALVSKRDGGTVGKLASELHGDPRWALVAFDDNTLLFLERTETNGRTIAENEYILLWPGDLTLSGITAESSERAAAEASRAVKLNERGVFARTALARSRMVGGNYAAAAEVYADLAIRGVAGPNYWRDYGYCLYMANRYQEAEEVFLTMIEDGMDPAFACYMRHFLALRRGDVTVANTLLNRALELCPSDEVYMNARKDLDAAMSAGASSTQTNTDSARGGAQGKE